MIRNSRKISAERFNLRPVPGYPNYAATDEGRIVKLFDNGATLVVLSEHVRFHALRVAITLPDGTETTAPVAKMIALAFIGGGPGDVIYLDGDAKNTHPDNIRWDETTLPVDPTSLADLRPAPGIPGVFLTADGRAFSIRSSHADGKLRLVKGSPDKRGYLRVKLTKDGESRAIPIHRLICEAFNGPCPGPHKPNVCHRNDINTDNRAENLYWGSDLDNHKDAVRNGHMIPYGTNGKIGTVHRGENSPHAVFNEDSVRLIRRRNAEGENYASLARELGVHPNSIRLICLRQTWSHVE